MVILTTCFIIFHSLLVIAVCHQGNDSQKAVVILKKILQDYDVSVKDIVGGLDQWTTFIDPSFPRY